MFAIIKTGGKQYKVTESQILRVEKLPQTEGEVVFPDVLLTSDGKDATIGTPMIPSATVTAQILSNGKADKKMVFRYKNKTRYRKKKGHRQPYTEVKITKISPN